MIDQISKLKDHVNVSIMKAVQVDESKDTLGTSVLVCGGRRLQEFPDKEYQVPNKEYQVPRQGISGSQQGAIIFQTVKLLFSIVRSTYAHT